MVDRPTTMAYLSKKTRLLAQDRTRLGLLGLIVLMGGVALTVGVQANKDTASYVLGLAYRTPLYPLYLWLLDAVFGYASLRVAFVLQLGFGLAVVYWFVLLIRRIFHMSTWLLIVATAILLMPYWGPLKVGNQILTEGLAYPLFLLALGHLLAAVVERRDASFLWFCAFTALAVLNRPQFIFLYPLGGLVLVWTCFARPAGRRCAIFALSFAAMILAAWLGDRAYHAVRHDAFVSVPFTGIQLFAGALYLSTADQSRLLSGEEAAFFADVHRRASDRHLLRINDPASDAIGLYGEHYHKRYNDIVWRIVVPSLRTHFSIDRELSPAEHVAADRMLVSISLRLLRDNPIEFGYLYVSNIRHGIARRVGLAVFGFMLLTVLPLALYRGVVVGEQLALALAVVMLAHLANLALVAVVEPPLARYLFYTEVAMFTFLFAYFAREGRVDRDAETGCVESPAG